MSTEQENRLLVEGDEDKRVLPYLVEKLGIPWESGGERLVTIHSMDGVTNFTTGQIRTQLKSSGLRRMGIVLDADTDPLGRWGSLRAALSFECTLPPVPPTGGFVEAGTTSGVRLGIWLMPDNSTRGMIETFLLELGPRDEPALYQHVVSSTTGARAFGAPFLGTHEDKAFIHAWLAWRDPPGRQLHQAINENMLSPNKPTALAFLSWFKQLYEVS
jgi:hypothetical protein